MNELLPYLQLFNILILPAVWGLFRLVRVLDKVEAFMETSTLDRKQIRERLDRIERPLIAQGIND